MKSLYMKKLLVAVCAVSVLIVLVCIDSMLEKSARPKPPEVDLEEIKQVQIRQWDDKSKYYVIAESDGDWNSDPRYPIARISHSSKSLDDFAKENKDFVSDYTYVYCGTKFDAKLFYKDNNYYVMYEVKSPKSDYVCYYIDNLCADIFINNKSTYAPAMMTLYLKKKLGDMILKKDISSYFDNYTFEQTKEFYERMDKEFYSIDEEHHIISVRGSSYNDAEYVDNALVIDFDNRTITARDADGNEEVYTEEG